MSNLVPRESATVSETKKGAIQGIAGAGAVEALKWGGPTLLGALGTLWGWWAGLVFPWSVAFGLGVVLILALIGNLIASMIVKLRRPSVESAAPLLPESAIDDPKLHENCEREIRNLGSTISRLQRNEQDHGTLISGKETHIEQLQTKLDALDWLVQIADEQGKTINRFVSIPDFRIGRFELYERNDPYIEFTLSIWNHSVHDIYLSELTGSIEFNGRELTRPIQWKEPSRSVTWSNQKSFTFRQNLSPSDVTHIMNCPASFSFYSLDVRIKGFGASQTKVDPQLLSLGTLALGNKPLLSSYPKLNIKIINLTARPVVNLFDSGITGSDAFVTMQTEINNGRENPIVIDSISLKITVKDQPYVAAAEFGDIWEKIYIDKQGKIATSGVKLSNLADRLPLRVLQANVSGSLQFIFKGVGAAILNQNIAYELMFIDTNGERHLFNGVINRQREDS